MFGRTTGFGTQPNTFGFGTNNTNTFGQSTQLFGGSTSGFSSAAPVFGTNSQPMFGSTPSSATSLFGTSNTSTFGQPNQSGFGSTLFGTSSQPSSSGIFGTTNTSSFGQQNKPTGFGFPSSSGGGLFSQSSQQTQQNAPSVFQSSSTSALFGSTNTFGSNTGQLGTVIKFVPVTGTDSVQKSGIVQSINTKHHCITCMKEYEAKSLEELRFEDYRCNRKGPQQQPPFGQPQPFGISSSSTSIFGQPDKPAFGTPRTDFGTPNFGMATQTTTSNIFGKPTTTGFITPTSTSAFPFATNTSSTGLFGASTAGKPFGTPSNQIFGSSQPQQSTFGNVFSQTNAQNSGGIFGKPATSTFNTPQSGFTFGNPQQNQPNLFQTSKPATGFGMFGQTNTQAPTFGQQTQQPTFGLNSTFGKPAQPTFGQPTQPAFGTQSIFGNNQSKPLFGNTTGGSIFGNSFQQNTPFQLTTQHQQQTPTLNQLEIQSQELRNLVHLDPYGYNKHLEGLSPIKPSMPAYVTNPKDLHKLLESPPPIAVVSPMNKRLQVLPISAKKTDLFDEVLEKELPGINFTLRTSAKRLLITKRKDADEHPQLDVQNAADLSTIGNNTALNSNKLDITPIEKYTEQPQEPAANSISSLITINTSLINDDSVPIIMSTNVEYQTQDSQTSTTDEPERVGDADNQIDTCGVKLVRAEYYTVPPLDKLIEHKQTDGQCLVKGFTIGRVAYGNVCFPDLMDVSNLDLDELIHFRYREVTIYPDDNKKPPEGQGLNRRAQVTLDRVYPKSKMDRKLITDTETLISINFSDTLRDLCEKHGTKFLDYRPETGSWVFMVEHFSKYGFSDSDDEEATSKIAEKQVQDQKKKKEQKKLKGELALKDHKNSEEALFKNRLMMAGDYVNGLDCSSIISAEHIFDVDMVIEEDSLGPHGASIENLDFDYNGITPSGELCHIRSRRNLYQCAPDNIYFMKASLYEDEHFEPVNIEDHDIETITAEPPLFKELPVDRGSELTKSVSKLQIQKPKIFSLQNNYEFVVDNFSYNERNYMDMIVFKGSSFKVGWGRGVTMTLQMVSDSPGSSPLSDIADQVNCVKIVDVSGLSEFDPFKGKLNQHLQVVLDTSDIIMQPNNIPLFTIRPGRASLLRHQLLARETAKDNIGDDSVTYYQQIWDICAAFWGPMSPPTNRRDLFSTWLENTVESIVEEELAMLEENSIFDRIFLNLTGNRVSEAAELAADAGLYNLSLLISELNASKKTKWIMEKQLIDWKSSNTAYHIHPTLQKIYMLIAGQNVGGFNSESPLETINVCDNLDWKRCLAIMLWNVASSSNSISAALELYRQDFEEVGFSVKPMPPFSEQENVFDLIYHLMLLHSGMGKPLETVLEPETHSFIPTDYRLSWLLLHALQSLQVGTVGMMGKTFMTTSFSEQLENLGLYKWAIFVLLFIEDIGLRKSYIMGVLHRNVQQDDTDRLIEDEIVTELCLPSDWIHEVKAYKSDILSMHWEAYKHFTYTGFWVECHEVALKHVIPQLIINDNYDTVGYILRDIEPGCRSIVNWQNEGGLLLMFFDLYEKFQEKQRFSREEAMSVHSLLVRVDIGIPKFPTTTAAQVAALSDIAKYCNLYEKLLVDQMSPTYMLNMPTATTKSNEYMIPPDYKLDDMKTEISSDNTEQDEENAMS